MPVPAHMQRTTGAFPINGKLGVKLEGYTEPRLERARERFLQRLTTETGIPLWPAANSNQPNIIISTKAASAPVQKLEEDESYELTVCPQRSSSHRRKPARRPARFANNPSACARFAGWLHSACG